MKLRWIQIRSWSWSWSWFRSWSWSWFRSWSWTLDPGPWSLVLGPGPGSGCGSGRLDVAELNQFTFCWLIVFLKVLVQCRNVSAAGFVWFSPDGDGNLRFCFVIYFVGFYLKGILKGFIFNEGRNGSNISETNCWFRFSLSVQTQGITTQAWRGCNVKDVQWILWDVTTIYIYNAAVSRKRDIDVFINVNQ